MSERASMHAKQAELDGRLRAVEESNREMARRLSEAGDLVRPSEVIQRLELAELVKEGERMRAALMRIRYIARDGQQWSLVAVAERGLGVISEGDEGAGDGVV